MAPEAPADLLARSERSRTVRCDRGSGDSTSVRSNVQYGFYLGLNDVNGRPGHIKPCTVHDQLFAALDWLPTFVDIAGGPKGDGLRDQIEAGQYPGIVKTTLDGVEQRDYLEGRSPTSARDVFFYYSGSTPSAVRYKNWKMHYNMAQLPHACLRREGHRLADPDRHRAATDPVQAGDHVQDATIAAVIQRSIHRLGLRAAAAPVFTPHLPAGTQRVPFETVSAAR